MVNKCKRCRNETKNRIFCSHYCKAQWDRDQRPVTKEWLYQKYIVEQLDAKQIARLAKRDQKTIYKWLRQYEIKTRPRGTTWKDNPLFNGDKKGSNNLFYGKKHTAESIAKMSESSKGPSPWLCGKVNAWYGKKGSESRTWKGGVTPERQAFYSSDEWKEAVKVVWKRDNATCQQCGKWKDEYRDFQFDIHHLVSFADSKKLRAVPSNLVLVCRPCHLWIHSKENTEKKFIKEINNEG